MDGQGLLFVIDHLGRQLAQRDAALAAAQAHIAELEAALEAAQRTPEPSA
jgi:hypothetical protein